MPFIRHKQRLTVTQKRHRRYINLLTAKISEYDNEEHITHFTLILLEFMRTSTVISSFTDDIESKSILVKGIQSTIDDYEEFYKIHSLIIDEILRVYNI